MQITPQKVIDIRIGRCAGRLWPPAHRSQDQTLITDARKGASADLRRRQTRYLITMGFRVACFVSMIWAPNPYRWFLMGGAIVPPYVAVLFANQADQRSHPSGFERGGREIENQDRKELDG